MSELKVVARGVAQKDIERWLDSKKISTSQRENYSDTLDKLVDAVADGYLIVEKDFTITHKLKFALGEDGKIDQIKYKNRIATGDVDPYLKGVKGSDADGRLKAYVCALTDQAVGIIKKLDTSDFGIAQSVAIFYLD